MLPLCKTNKLLTFFLAGIKILYMLLSYWLLQRYQLLRSTVTWYTKNTKSPNIFFWELCSYIVWRTCAFLGFFDKRTGTLNDLKQPNLTKNYKTLYYIIYCVLVTKSKACNLLLEKCGHTVYWYENSVKDILTQFSGPFFPFAFLNPSLGLHFFNGSLFLLLHCFGSSFFPF